MQGLNRTLPYRQIKWLLGFILILFLLCCSGEMALGYADLPLPPALVRIDVRTPDDLVKVAASGIKIYARLSDVTGQTYLLAQVDPVQQGTLARQDLAVRLLDPDTGDATYYLLYARQPKVLRQADLPVTILDIEGHQALARATPAQAEQLLAWGIELRHLALHPLILHPEEQIAPLGAVTMPNPVVQAMMAQVEAATVYSYTGNLSGEWPVIVGDTPYTILTRYSRTTEPIEKATQYAYERFQSLGLSVAYHDYHLPGTGLRRNVVAEQAGLADPDRILLITAHLDSTSEDPYSQAPGADDNISGAVGVLIAAEILSQHSFGCTLRYVLFTGEEQGLYGSAAYASYVSASGEDIEGVLNMDMIAYNSDASPIVELHTRWGDAGDLAMANLFADVIATYGLGLTAEIVQDGIQASDHASFWDYGYSAILSIEDLHDSTPYYHTTSDRLDTLDLAYYTNLIKASIGTFAHMGCLLESGGQLTGTAYDVGTGLPISGTLIQATLSPTLTWSTTTGDNGVYQLSLLSSTYAVTASAPWYMPYVAAGIAVTTGQTTTLDIPLQIAPTFTVSGHVQEAVTHQPLSATLSLPGFPLTPAQTEPATGVFSLTLPWGSHTLQAEAPGYLPQSHFITVTADRTEDFYLYPIWEILADDVESGNIGWTAEGDWAITTEASHSPSHSWTDSPGRDYGNDWDVSLTSPIYDLSAYQGIALSFWHTYDLESGYDHGYVEYSTDGGGIWRIAASYNDEGQRTWTQELLSLPALDGQANACIRFRLQSNGWVTSDGWHIDDIALSGAGHRDKWFLPLIVKD
ncbi:MAG: M28 family peptidase [Anaerolineae bacterium]|nr:MAG: M28 family peptidase [Anaerolineae bacterium]